MELFDHNMPVNVHGYDAALGGKQYRIIRGAIACMHPYFKTRYHLVLHQAVYVPDLQRHLLCPMQCRAHGVTANDCRNMYCKDLDYESHSIVATDEYGARVSWISFFVVLLITFLLSLFCVKSMKLMIAHGLSSPIVT